MKKNIFFYVIASILSGVLFTACDDISDDGFSVVQPGDLTLSASLAQKEYGYEGSEGTIRIQTNTKWTASTEATWITLGSTSGSGNSDLSFTVSQNTTTSSRNATIQISSVEEGVQSQILELSQGFTNLTVSKNNLTFSQSGGSQNIEVTSSTEWTAFFDSDYITVSPEKGSGENTPVTITCSPNNSISTRTFTVVFQSTEDNGATNQSEVNIVQEGGSFGLSVVSRSLSAINGSSDFSITSDVGWTITLSDASWCHVDRTSGTGNANIIITADDNDESTQRTATITVTAAGNADSRSIAVVQAGAPANIQSTVVEVIYRDYTSVIIGYSLETGTELIGRGVVYVPASEKVTPTLQNADVFSDVVSEGENSFRADIPSLKSTTEYVVRGYLTIVVDGVEKTYYGASTRFTTKSNPASDDNPNPSNP